MNEFIKLTGVAEGYPEKPCLLNRKVLMLAAIGKDQDFTTLFLEERNKKVTELYVKETPEQIYEMLEEGKTHV